MIWIRLQRIIVFGIIVMFLITSMNTIILEGKSSIDSVNNSNINYRFIKEPEFGIPFNEWSMWRGDSNHTGNASCIGPSSWNQLWRTNQKSYKYSSPAVKYGNVYIGRETALYCYDIATGSTIWSYNLSSNLDSTPLVFRGRVYIGSGSYLYCLDANGTGINTTLYWTALIGGTVDSSPTTDGDDDIFIASGNGYLRAIFTNGTEHWSSSINTGASSSPAYWNGRVYCGGGTWAGGNNKVYCFNADTGELIWSHQLDSPPCSSPALAYGNVYIAGSGDVLGTGEFGNIYCLDAKGSGGETTEIWKHKIGGSYSSPALGYGRVYIGSNTRNFYCLDAFGNGSGGTTQYWTRTFNDWSHSSPIITPKYVFTGAGDGRFYCLNRTDSSTVWSQTLGGDGYWGISSSPALAGNLIFVTNDGDGLYCVGAKIDIEPPRITNTFPNSNATKVSQDVEIKIGFNKPVDPTSVSEKSLILKDSNSQTIIGTVRLNKIGNTAYFKPKNPLKKNDKYTVTVTTDIVDSAGLHLDGDQDGTDEGAGIDEYSFSFTTVPPYPPKIGQIPIQRPNEDILYIANLSTYVTDKDTPKEMLTLEVNSSHITVDGLKLHMLYTNGISTEVVNLSVSDGESPTKAYRDFIVVVITDNDPPELTFIPPLSLTEDIPFEIDMSNYIVDQDTPYSNITLTDNSSYTEIMGFIINFTYPNGVSHDLVNVSVYDGNNTEYLEITVIISPVNDPPIISELLIVDVYEGIPLNLSLEDFISDIDNEKQDLIITVDSQYIKVYGHVLNLTYPEGIKEDYVDIKVSDGLLVVNTTLIVHVLRMNNTMSNVEDDNDIGRARNWLDEQVFSVIIIVFIIIATIIIILMVIVKNRKTLKTKDKPKVNTDNYESLGMQTKKENNHKKPKCF